MQNYRDPPPYPSHSKQTFTNQPGFRQSYSGSETSTDVSISSNENLATSQRQEPQGEETQTSFNYHLDLGSTDGSSYSILERLGMPARVLESTGKTGSGSNILDGTASQERAHQQNLSFNTSVSSGLRLSANSSPLYTQGYLTVPEWQLGNKVLRLHGTYTPQQKESSPRLAEYASPSTRTDTETLYSSSSSSSLTMLSREGGGSYSSHISSSDRTSSGGGNGSGSGILLPSSSSYQYLSPRVPPVSTYHHPHPYVNTHWIIGSDDFQLNSYSTTAGYNSSSTSSSVTYSKTGNSGVSTNTYSSQDHYLTNLPPPPEYPGGSGVAQLSEKATDIRTCRSYEAMDKLDSRRSQPDLRLCASSPGIFLHDVKFQSPQRSSNNSADDTDHISLATKASQMVDMLTEENRVLREELAMSAVKVAKLQKFELEIQKVHESHEALVKSSQKQEVLWSAMRRKLEEKIKELETPKSDGAGTQNRIRLAEKDAMISKLLSQNHDLSALKDQLEGENSQLTLSLAEQKARVDILENALLNAQSKILAFEEEFYKKQTDGSKVEQLKKALTSLQNASEKQQLKEKEMRTHLEKELEIYKAQEKGGTMKKPDLGKEDMKSTGLLRKILEEKDAKILQLESQMAELEQKYVKETTLRQFKLEEANETPKEVRLAALEKNSSDMDKLIDEVKTEKLKHMEELHQSQRQVAELEAKVKQLQTHLVEKEAMVKVFQRAPLTMARSSSLHALCHSPKHTQHPSLITSHAWPGCGQALDSLVYRDFATIRHVKTGSTSAIELGRKMSMEDDLLSKVKSLDTASKSDSEDEGKLFHV